MTRVTLVGCGLVGGSWAVVFARAGLGVTLWDPQAASVDAAFAFAREAAAALAARDLLPAGTTPDALLGRMRRADSLAEAVRDADHVQESAPERLPIKQALYREMMPLVRADAVVASSTSGLPASAFTADVERRERCLVAHPINPPHLIPLVEIVPAPWTAPAAAEATEALMRQVGQAPIRLEREVAGFIANRLQGAVLAEAFRLVEDGVCSAAAVDAAITEGLGLRWAFIGPFETIDLNAQGGISDYCAKLGPMYHDLAREQADPRPWGEALVARVEAERRTLTPADGLDARKGWRDRVLAALVGARRSILAGEN